MGLFMERETEAWKGPRPIQGHKACERQSQGLNSAWSFLEPVLLLARPGSPWGCCPEVSRQVLRSNCLPGKQAEPPEGPPLKGCIHSHIQVLCSLETRICLCHSAPHHPQSQAGGCHSDTANTSLRITGLHSGFIRVREKSQMVLPEDSS